MVLNIRFYFNVCKDEQYATLSQIESEVDSFFFPDEKEANLPCRTKYYGKPRLSGASG